MAHTGMVPVQPSARKVRARRELQRLAVTVSDGTAYGLGEAVLPNVTLADARRALERLPKSLTQTILDERQIS